jgi:hypothetical protein
MKKGVGSGVGSGSGTGSISWMYGSDPDPNQNVTDPQHGFTHTLPKRIETTCNGGLKCTSIFRPQWVSSLKCTIYR